VVDQVTLAEAAELLSVPIGTLYVWKADGRIHPSGIIRNPRKTAVFDIDEVRAVADATPRRTRR
jgi:predicted site-specific integrase-resolvase